jgi:hypothetical protein
VTTTRSSAEVLDRLVTVITKWMVPSMSTVASADFVTSMSGAEQLISHCAVTGGVSQPPRRAMAETSKATGDPGVHAGIVRSTLNSQRAPGSTSEQVCSVPSTVSTMVSGAAEQFRALPVIRIGCPGQAASGPHTARTSSTQAGRMRVSNVSVSSSRASPQNPTAVTRFVQVTSREHTWASPSAVAWNRSTTLVFGAIDAMFHTIVPPCWPTVGSEVGAGEAWSAYATFVHTSSVTTTFSSVEMVDRLVTVIS